MCACVYTSPTYVQHTYKHNIHHIYIIHITVYKHDERVVTFSAGLVVHTEQTHPIVPHPRSKPKSFAFGVFAVQYVAVLFIFSRKVCEKYIYMQI